MLKIEIEVAGLERKLNSMQGALKKDLAPVLNEVAEAAAMDIRREVTSTYGTSDAEVRGSMRLTKANVSKLAAEIGIWGSPRKKGRSLNLIHFLQRQSTAGTLRRTGLFGTATGADERKRQAHAEQVMLRQLDFLIKRGVIKQVPGAFVANAGRTVFRRVGKSRLPIVPVQTIGHGQMFSSHAIRDPVLAKAKTLLEARILKLLINGAARPQARQTLGWRAPARGDGGLSFDDLRSGLLGAGRYLGRVQAINRNLSRWL